MRLESAAEIKPRAGETFDFEFVPHAAGEHSLTVWNSDASAKVLELPIEVSEKQTGMVYPEFK